MVKMIKTNNVPARSDFYKTDHRRQLPKGITLVYSNFTARMSRIADISKIVSFGLQYFIKKYLVDDFNEHFFGIEKKIAVKQYKRILDNALGKDSVPMDHIEALWELGYLPLHIKALPEGSLVPLQVPLFTVVNTHVDFAWLTNFIETIASATVWGPCTSATTAFEYRKTFEYWARKTGAPKGFVPWQGHDFSFRGMFGCEAAQMSGAGHLLSFTGTDTIPAINFLEEYYNADCEKELVGGSVSASEHACMCAGGKETELETYRRFITEVYPSGIVSIVSDTWDFWNVVTNILPKLKKEIMNRDGKLVIRPDSGDPVLIITGDENAPIGTPENKGLIQCLWDIFGGTTTPEGFKMLDPHIGAIYGDSITRERQQQILARLAANGFASSNVVLGIGSYTYQYVTRDTFGFAMKSTYCEVNGEGREIFKEPKTDKGKNSHKGLIHVSGKSGSYKATFPVSKEMEESSNNELKTVFLDGQFEQDSLKGIRARIEKSIAEYLESIVE